MSTFWKQQYTNVGDIYFLLIDDLNFLLIDDAGHKLILADGNILPSTLWKKVQNI